MDYSYSKDCALLINTSDRYIEALNPLMNLIKIYWPNHPDKVYFNFETKGYEDKDISTIAFYENDENITWSKRLLNCLNRIEEDYVFFSLEDFFLLGKVNDEEIEKCYNWMKTYSEIAVCRLKSSSHPFLTKDERFDTFRVAGKNVGYRLDTQLSLWRKSDLISFIDETENPWGFEEKGTKRIIDTEKVFLWHWADDEDDINQMIFPYHMKATLGYGIAWGKWLWKNKKWFKANGINNVKFYKLGTISERTVKIRRRYLYRVGQPAPKGKELVYYKILLNADRISRAYHLVLGKGFKDTFSVLNKWFKK